MVSKTDLFITANNALDDYRTDGHLAQAVQASVMAGAYYALGGHRVVKGLYYRPIMLAVLTVVSAKKGIKGDIEKDRLNLLYFMQRYGIGNVWLHNNRNGDLCLMLDIFTRDDISTSHEITIPEGITDEVLLFIARIIIELTINEPWNQSCVEEFECSLRNILYNIKDKRVA